MHTKITYILLLLSALICGPTIHAEDNIFGTLYDNKDIFALYDKAYDNAAEITEYRGERLFEILQSDSVGLFLDKLSKQKPSIKKRLINDCSMPPEYVDLPKCISNVYDQTKHRVLRKQILKNLRVELKQYYAMKIAEFPVLSADSVFIHNLAQSLSTYLRPDINQHLFLEFNPENNNTSNIISIQIGFHSLPPTDDKCFMGFTKLNNLYFWFPYNTPQDLLTTKINVFSEELCRIPAQRIWHLSYHLKTKKVELKLTLLGL